ncbi:MAG TPA: DUF3011 domain-containing protein [Woeseiaceae bacterium]|nr:DUF3011 domain-containing protein [Woeseiaceae bacterium]
MRHAFSIGTGMAGIIGFVALLATSVAAQEATTGISAATLRCHSAAGERQSCPGDTSAGVAMLRSTGTAACLLGNTWGYDDAGVWVANGCGGEFVLGQQAGPGEPETLAPAEQPDYLQAADNFTWGEFDPGNGFLIGSSPAGTLSISAYALARYIDQSGDDTFTDHNGNVQPVDLRRDIYSHRILVWLKGWIGVPKLVYTITFWTVNTTDQDALFGNIGYQFSKKFNLYAGVYGNPGSRSLQGSHPYWLGNDRVMADEFFRAFFTSGIYANGEVLPGLWYSVSAGNTNSILGTRASQLDRKLTTGGSVWWMPTTQEFGPRGAYGDWEMHEEVATRFGLSYTDSPEQRYTDVGDDPQNTSLRFADSLNVFSTGALAPGVTITEANYRILAVDAGIKYRGMFLQAEYFHRWLDSFLADGALPVAEVIDTGFYVQGSFFPIPRKLELYAATSQIFGDADAGFGDSHEYLVGMNYYPTNSRNHRLNLQLIDVTRSPVSSVFGYYTGGQDGTTVAAAFSIFF